MSLEAKIFSTVWCIFMGVVLIQVVKLAWNDEDYVIQPSAAFLLPTSDALWLRLRRALLVDCVYVWILPLVIWSEAGLALLVWVVTWLLFQFTTALLGQPRFIIPRALRP